LQLKTTGATGGFFIGQPMISFGTIELIIFASPSNMFLMLNQGNDLYRVVKILRESKLPEIT
jgi:hypothetical protein